MSDQRPGLVRESLVDRIKRSVPRPLLGLPVRLQWRIAGITKGPAGLCEKARRRIEIGHWDLECHYPEGAERLSVALSDLDDLEEYAERIIRMRTSPRH
jgi:hypothetical protein